MKRKIFNIIFVLLVVSTLTLSIKEEIRNKNTVENFCSIKHQHDVETYKSCKEMDLKNLVIKLTKEEQEKDNQIVPLTVIE